MRDNGFFYLAAINPKRFKEVWEPLKLKVSKTKPIACAYNDDTGEFAVHILAPGKLKQYLLTNAFAYHQGPKKLKSIIFSEVYSFTFNTADRLNHVLAERMWPHWEVGWESSFDDFHFSTLLWNVYVVWHESNKIRKETPWPDFTKMLCSDLLQV